jgi:hypothetical protein
MWKLGFVAYACIVPAIQEAEAERLLEPSTGIWPSWSKRLDLPFLAPIFFFFEVKQTVSRH